jgi:hypothetical protein
MKRAIPAFLLLFVDILPKWQDFWQDIEVNACHCRAQKARGGA